MTVNNFGFAL